MKVAIARKVGMTQIFDEKGNFIPVTLLEVTPNVVVESGIMNNESWVKLAVKTRKKATRPILGILKKVGIDQVLTTFKQFKGQGKLEPFQVGDKVKVSGITKGKGFAGTVKRHSFRKGPVSHGSDNVRQPGSIGAQQPQRVVKGKKMAGHMGVEKRTVKNLAIVEIDKNLLAIKGSVPGPNKGWIYVWQ